MTVYDGVVSDATIDATPGPSDVVIDKVEENNLANGENFQFQWRAFSGAFVARSSQVTIAFKNGSFSTFDAAGYLDEASVEARPVEPVPTLGFIGLLLTVLGLPLLARRSMRKTSSARQPR